VSGEKKMKNTLVQLIISALLGLLLVSPFAVMEVVNRRNFGEVFPFQLFLGLWLLPSLFVFVLIPIVQDLRSGKNILTNPVGLLLRAVFMGMFALMWINTLADQWPCFMGVLYCD
jgi:hypothetical protein